MFTKDPEELKNKETEMINTLEGINSRIAEEEEQISDVEDRMVEITTTAQNIGKKKKKMSSVFKWKLNRMIFKS